MNTFNFTLNRHRLKSRGYSVLKRTPLRFPSLQPLFDTAKANETTVMEVAKAQERQSIFAFVKFIQRRRSTNSL